ncbi:MAG: TIGR03087 family PEP-CTERM/XrtA system glycosyltransferase [Planctomycetota bacterium]
MVGSQTQQVGERIDAVERAARTNIAPAVVRRPQILFLAHRVPYPPNRGDRIRSFHELEFLSQRADVSLAFTCEVEPPPETMSVLGRMCRRVAAFPLGRYSRWCRGLSSLALQRTATQGLFSSSLLRATIRTWSRRERFCSVFCFCSSMAQYLDEPSLRDVPAVVDLVDVDSQKWFDYAAHSWGPKHWLYHVEGGRLRKMEVKIARRATALLLVSKREADLFRTFCPTDKVITLTNGVDLDYFHPTPPRNPSLTPRCVFVGALDYGANIDGLTWFCREVWPGIRRRSPIAVFDVVGSNPRPAVVRLGQSEGVRLVGEVPDVRPHLADAAVVVIPLRVARGLQNKVLEAMAMGKAVVASPAALEGVGATAGIHAEEAATENEWIAAVGALLEQPARQAELGLAARAFVERHYCWSARLSQLEKVPGLVLATSGQVRTAT